MAEILLVMHEGREANDGVKIFFTERIYVTSCARVQLKSGKRVT